MLPWVLCAALAMFIFVLCVRLHLIHRSLREIDARLAEILAGDTNVLIDLSSGDRQLRSFAASLNRQLRLLRKRQNCFLSGDRELKEAIANISHDLRTPLTAICGYMDLLEREEQSEAARRYLSIIAGRADAMRELTEELLRYTVAASAGEPLEVAPLSLNDVLEEAVAESYAALCSRSIAPEICMPDAPVVRALNRAALLRVFENLLSNAARHSDGDLEICLAQDGSVCFSNAASGLDELQVGRLFDRFYTVETARGSTGLGLSIARVLTERMGGRIDAGYAGGRLTIRLQFPA